MPNFYPFYLGVSLLKQNSRKKGYPSCLGFTGGYRVRGLLASLMKVPSALLWYCDEPFKKPWGAAVEKLGMPRLEGLHSPKLTWKPI